MSQHSTQMPMRTLGRTGVQVSLIGLGGWHLGFKQLDEQLAVHTLEVAKENGSEFDTVQMPLNVMDAHYRSFEKLVLPELVKQNIGVLGMKALANGTILESKTVSAIECLQYAMNLPTSVVITGCGAHVQTDD